MSEGNDQLELAPEDGTYLNDLEAAEAEAVKGMATSSSEPEDCPCRTRRSEESDNEGNRRRSPGCPCVAVCEGGENSGSKSSELRD